MTEKDGLTKERMAFILYGDEDEELPSNAYEEEWMFKDWILELAEILQDAESPEADEKIANFMLKVHAWLNVGLESYD